jgi:restriction endonuclease Mrr
MKKNFKMTHPKIKVPRLVEAIKFEVKKYIKRERRKSLPANADYWDFDCRFGVDEASSDVIHLSAINKAISQAESDQLESFYLEILAKPGYRSKRPNEEQQANVGDPAIQSIEEEEPQD